MSEIFDQRQIGKSEEINKLHSLEEQRGTFTMDESMQELSLTEAKKLSARNKKENSEHVGTIALKLWEDSFSLIGDVLARRQVLCEKDELCDFAAFMGENALEAMDLLTLFVGEDEELTGMDKMAALDRMRGTIMETYPETIEPCSDEELTEKARDLESLSWRVTSFDSLSKRYDYLGELSSQKKKQTEEKLTRLRSTACYYLIRKELITDPEYIDNKGDVAEGTELFMKLRDAKMAEKNMLGQIHIPTRQLLEKYFDRSEMMKLAENLIDKSIKRREVQI